MDIKESYLTKKKFGWNQYDMGANTPANLQRKSRFTITRGSIMKDLSVLPSSYRISAGLAKAITDMSSAT